MLVDGFTLSLTRCWQSEIWSADRYALCMARGFATLIGALEAQEDCRLATIVYSLCRTQVYHALTSKLA